MGFCSSMKIVFPVLFAILWSPLPRRLGVYERLHNMDDASVGIWPSSFSSVDKWGFTFDDLYGDGGFSDDASVQKYRRRLWGQTAIVTGANIGMGYEIALALTRLGASVTLACRTPSKCEAAARTIRDDAVVRERGDPEARLETMTVDVASHESVVGFCRGYLARHGGVPLDMLFLNAGILHTGGEKNLYSVDGIERTFHTNVVGHHLMYRLLERVLFFGGERATPARVVLTSSAASYDTLYPYKVATDLETLNNDPPIGRWSPYPQSKLAQVLWAKELTDRLDRKQNGRFHEGDDPNQKVYVNSAHPGWVGTNILSNGIFDAMPYPKLFEFVVLKVFGRICWTAEEGALTMIYLGTAVDDLRNQTIRGQYFHPQSIWVKEHRNARSDDPTTKVLQQKTWDFLEDLVKDHLPKE